MALHGRASQSMRSSSLTNLATRQREDTRRSGPRQNSRVCVRAASGMFSTAADWMARKPRSPALLPGSAEDRPKRRMERIISEPRSRSVSGVSPDFADSGVIRDQNRVAFDQLLMDESFLMKSASPSPIHGDGTTANVCVRVLSVGGGELALLEDLPSDCYRQSAHYAVTQHLHKRKLLPARPRRCKLLCNCLVLEASDTTTLQELVESYSEKPAVVEVTLVGMSMTKPHLSMKAQKAVDEDLLEAIALLDTARVDELLAEGADALLEHPLPYLGHHTMLPLHLAVWMTYYTEDAQALWVSLRGRRGAMMRRGTELQDPSCCRSCGREIIVALLEDGADPTAVHRKRPGLHSNEIGTAFELALPNILYDTDLLRAFLDKGANPNATSNARVADMYEPVLHMAIALRQPESAQLLLDAGVLVDSTRDEIRQPVMTNAKMPIWSPIALIPNEADAKEEDAEENSSSYQINLYLRDQMLQRETIRQRRAAGISAPAVLAEKASMTALHFACAAGDLSMSAWLLCRGANPNAIIQTIATSPPISRKSSTGNSRLISKADHANHPASGFMLHVVEETPLQLAIEIGCTATPLVTLLVLAGADVNYPAGLSGKSPQALCNGSPSLLGALQACWSDPMVQTRFGENLRPDVEATLAHAKLRTQLGQHKEMQHPVHSPRREDKMLGWGYDTDGMASGSDRARSDNLEQAQLEAAPVASAAEAARRAEADG